MNGFMCDVMVFDEKTGVTKYYTDLPFRHVMEKPEFKDAKHVFTIHLTYGRDK